MLNVKASLLALTFLILIAPTQLLAAVVSGQITNVDGDGDDNVNDLSISLITFEASAGDVISIDAITGFDAGNSFRSTLMLMANDVDIASKHSMSTSNSLTYQLQSTGEYTLAIGYRLYTLEDALLGYEYDNSLAAATGDWQLTFSFSAQNVQLVNPSPIPLPAALPLFITALTGLSLFRRRC